MTKKIDIITDKDGNIVANPAILYSSSKENQNRFRVIAPDGTCVIGGSNNCLVKESTFGQRGNFMSITIGDQVLREDTLDQIIPSKGSRSHQQIR